MKLKNMVPILGVTDVARSVDFYKNALDFEVKQTYEANGKLIWASLQSGAIALMVALVEPDGGRPA